MASDRFPYRSLSSVARMLLPKAQTMHRQGMPWREVAACLEISQSALFIWRRLERTGPKHWQSVPGSTAPPLRKEAGTHVA